MSILDIYVCPHLKIRNYFVFTLKMMIPIWFGFIHLLIVENFINIYFLRNNGTMWQTIHLRFTYFTLFDLTILTYIFCPNIILWVDVKITLLSIESSLTLLRLFKAEEKSWLSLLVWEVDISCMWNLGGHFREKYNYI
jgi:hypothetical protein